MHPTVVSQGQLHRLEIVTAAKTDHKIVGMVNDYQTIFLKKEGIKEVNSRSPLGTGFKELLTVPAR